MGRFAIPLNLFNWKDTMYTVIPYLYRDAANHKAHNEIVLSAELNQKEQDLIRSKLSDGEYFIPGDLVGLHIPELQRRMIGGLSEEDHVFHELRLDGQELLEKAPKGATIIPKDAFVAAFSKISGPYGWDIERCLARLGIPV